MRVQDARETSVGPWKVLMSDEQVMIPPTVVGEIEDMLQHRYLPYVQRAYAQNYVPNLSMRMGNIPAPIIRLDMPPAYQRFRGIYEVEANSSGLGIASHMRIPVASAAARALRALDIHEVGWFSAQSRISQHEDHRMFMQKLDLEGIKTHELDYHDTTTLPLWLRAGQEDLDANGLAGRMDQCLLLHYDGGGEKGYLPEIDDARLLGSLEDPTQAFFLYPDGFCLKPVRSWGTMNVNFWMPRRCNGAITRTKMIRILGEAAASPAEYVVQRLHEPRQCEEGHRWIWRLFFGWDGERYRAIGGFESGRPGLRVHGASDTVSVPLHVQHPMTIHH